MRLATSYLIRWVAVTVLIAAFAAWALAVRAGEAPAPQGPSVLTLGGAVERWNTGPVDAETHGLFQHHSLTFARGMAFDSAMLDALAQGSVTAHPPQLDAPGEFTGPTLAAVLEAADADPETLAVVGLDGYRIELARADREDRDWIVATRVDGAPLAIGRMGPLWIAHPPADGVVPTDEEEARWVWAVFYMDAD